MVMMMVAAVGEREREDFVSSQDVMGSQINAHKESPHAHALIPPSGWTDCRVRSKIVSRDLSDHCHSFVSVHLWLFCTVHFGCKISFIVTICSCIKMGRQGLQGKILGESMHHPV